MRLALLTLFCTLSALAQWPTDPAQNLLICNHAGEEAVPKIAATSDGGCYITWWDHTSGNYDVYLQLLDADGVPQWANPCGMLVSNYPQATWLTDWDMAVDAEDNCIIAVNDTRAGDDRDITVYKFNHLQQALWGVEGIMLSDNDGFEPDPRIAPLPNGDVAFAWQDDNVIHVRRLNAAGQDVFTPPTITLTSLNGLSIPRLCATDDNAVVLSYLVHQGTQFSSPRWIYLQKISEAGTFLWNPNGLPVMTTNGIGIQMKPDVIHDGAGGAYSFWYDTRNNVHHVYAQHVNSGGIAEWTANGVQADLTANELQMSPSAVLADSGIVLFYQTANSNQSQGGVDAQYIASSGDLLWNLNGVTIVPLSTSPCFNVRAHVQGNDFGVFYSQYAPGSGINTLLRASQLNAAGVSTWAPPITDLCTVSSEKGRPYTSVNPQGQILACWPDARGGNMDMYMQNVNADGMLGPNTVLPPEIVITFPADNDIVRNEIVNVEFEVLNYIIDPDFGDGYISVMVNDQDPWTENSLDPIPVALTPGENLVTLEILDLDFQQLEPRALDSVHIQYDPRNPSLVITYPPHADTLEVYDAPITVRFDVTDFVVADSGGDGFVHLEVRAIEPDFVFETSNHVATDSLEVPLWAFSNNEVVLSLVDYNGDPLVPPVADTVYVVYWEVSADDPVLLPSSFVLSAYPNPFNSTVTLSYDVPRPATLALEILDVTGRHVVTVLEGAVAAGNHVVQWQADDFPSGTYFAKLSSGGFSQTQKIILLK